MIYNLKNKNKEKNGQAAIIAVLLMLVIMLSAVFGVSAMALKEAKVAKANQESRFSFFSAEAGVEDAVYRLKRGKNLSASYTVSLNGAPSIINVNTISSAETQITSTGNASGATRAIFADLVTSTETINFFYGVQVGDVGLEMGNGATVNGNVYSNGNIIGSNGSVITGSATVAGGISDTPSFQWAANDSDQYFATASANRDIAQSFTANASDRLNMVSVYLGKVGSPAGNITMRITTDNGGKPSTSGIASATIANSTVGITPSWIDVSFSSPPMLTNGTQYWIVLDYSSNNASNYWNWKKDSSDAYANNTGKYTSNCCSGNPTWTNAGGDLDFRVWIGGVSTRISGVTIGDASSGSGHANLFTNTTIHGSACPNTYCIVENPPRINMPISDGVIQDWRNAAAAGGTCSQPLCDASGNLNVTGTQNVGPLYIPGTLTVTNNATLIVSGTIWVGGNISLSNNCVVNLSSGYGGLSGVILTDNNIVVSNNCSFSGSGSPSSHIMLLSARDAPTAEVIKVNNNSAGVIFYASKGKLELENNAAAKEAVGYGIELENNANINYETGLSNVNFSSGPGGGWEIASWEEIIP